MLIIVQYRKQKGTNIMFCEECYQFSSIVDSSIYRMCGLVVKGLCLRLFDYLNPPVIDLHLLTSRSSQLLLQD